MTKVLLDLSVSLDGYAAGPDVGPEEPMGRGGEALHEWMFAGRSAAEARSFMTEQFAGMGAVISGRRTADLGIGLWGDEPVFHAPVFVVTRRPAETIVKKGGTSYVFVAEGIEETLARARDAAGTKDIRINGGADIARQYLYAGAVQELHLHLVPVVLGDGERLFDRELPPGIHLEPLTATSTPLATHLTYEVTATMPA